MSTSHKVTFLNVNQTVEAQDGESILDVAINHDIPLQHACGGFCSCTTCHVYIKEGLSNVSPQEEMEKERIEETAEEVKPESRLGCQTKVHGDLSVHIVNVEP